jgi:hypothetical protein
MPPPRTRFISPSPESSRRPSLLSMEDSGRGCSAARFLPLPPEVPCSDSSKLFQLPHSGQRPSHLGSSCRQTAQMNFVLFFALVIVKPLLLYLVDRQRRAPRPVKTNREFQFIRPYLFQGAGAPFRACTSCFCSREAPGFGLREQKAGSPIRARRPSVYPARSHGQCPEPASAQQPTPGARGSDPHLQGSVSLNTNRSFTQSPQREQRRFL